jgi:hypothetical protein
MTTVLWELPAHRATSTCNDALRRWRKVMPLESIKVNYQVNCGYDSTGRLVKPRPLHWLVRLTFDNKKDATLFKLGYMGVEDG